MGDKRDNIPLYAKQSYSVAIKAYMKTKHNFAKLKMQEIQNFHFSVAKKCLFQPDSKDAPGISKGVEGVHEAGHLLDVSNIFQDQI